MVSAKLNALNRRAYLEWLLTEMPDDPHLQEPGRIDRYLPWSDEVPCPAEEMWDVVMEMLEATIAVQDAMHEDYMIHTPEKRQALLDACIGSSTASEEWWKNTLLGYEEMPDYPAQITGDMHSE